ncbi:hypothetical protein BROUX41_006292 [Berkeleyomyces rouxiae]|uniref:uncharacterized protein n=1 Tax=Berkeleyomyces rouxiae TaxID=2035830 RepID=UPI003B76BC97
MEMPSLHTNGESLEANTLGLEPNRLLPENTAEYQLFIIGRQLCARQQLSRLQEVRREFARLRSTLTKDYIWYKENDSLQTKDDTRLIHLASTIEYGDSVDDEWLMVYLLRQLSLSFPDLWVRISDSDGEFLLVEAASAVPKWLSPEMDRFRVWLHRGQLLVLPPFDLDLSLETIPRSSSLSRDTERHVLSLEQAVQSITQRVCNPNSIGTKSQSAASAAAAVAASYGLYHSEVLEKEAFHRMRNFPDQINQMLHHSLLTIPRKLAYILHERSKSVAPAVEAFYLRDPVSLKPILATSGDSPSSSSKRLNFPPIDLVTISVKFTKVLFAQLRSQRFETPPIWTQAIAKARATTEKLLQDEAQLIMDRIELGMKLTTGFEILAAKAEQSDNRLVREISILLEDIEVDGHDALPTPEEMAKWEGASRDDDDSWLDIDFNEFERELEGKKTAAAPSTSSSPSDTKNKTASGFGDANAQESLRKIVSRFETFLNDESAGIDGVNIRECDIEDEDNDNDHDDDDGGNMNGSDSDSEDNDGPEADKGFDVEFDENAFTKMMKEVLTLQSTLDSSTAHMPKPENPRTLSNKDQEMEEAVELMHQMEAELKRHGALTLDDPSTATAPRTKAKLKTSAGLSIPQASRAVTHGAAHSFAGDDLTDDSEDDADADDADQELDIDFNLAKNLLESFKSQGGAAGPASNLLGLMGFQLPRDEGSGDEA